MIHGVTMCSASSSRTTIATRTTPLRTSIAESDWSDTTASKRVGGNSVRLGGDSVAKAYLACPRDNVGQLGIVFVQANFVGGLRDVAEHRVANRRPAGAFLERGDVEVGDAPHVVLAAGG